MTPEQSETITAPPSNHPLNGLKLGSERENFNRNANGYNLLMHHVRQAVVYMNNPARQEARVLDIEFFLDRIREDFSAIAFYGEGGVSHKTTSDEVDR